MPALLDAQASAGGPSLTPQSSEHRFAVAKY
jgi:hypothetical protein